MKGPGFLPREQTAQGGDGGRAMKTLCLVGSKRKQGGAFRQRLGFRQKTRRRRSATQGPAACMQASVNFAVTRAHASCEETNIHTNVCAYIYRLYIYIYIHTYTHTHITNTCLQTRHPAFACAGGPTERNVPQQRVVPTHLRCPQRVATA